MEIQHPTRSEINDLILLLRDECKYRCNDQCMAEFLGTGRIRTLNRGEAIITAGSIDSNIYIVMEGITRHWYWNGNHEKTMGFSQAGTVLISYHSYYFGKGSFYTIEACCPTKILCIKNETYNQLIASSHDFAQWCLSMAQCQIFFFEMKNRVISGTAKERYISFLKNRPDILKKVQLKTIASYLDVTPQYLSKLRNMRL